MIPPPLFSFHIFPVRKLLFEGNIRILPCLFATNLGWFLSKHECLDPCTLTWPQQVHFAFLEHSLWCSQGWCVRLAAKSLQPLLLGQDTVLRCSSDQLPCFSIKMNTSKKDWRNWILSQRPGVQSWFAFYCDLWWSLEQMT